MWRRASCSPTMCISDAERLVMVNERLTDGDMRRSADAPDDRLGKVVRRVPSDWREVA